MANELLVNTPRLGWYVDGLPDDVSPQTATMLIDDGVGITLTIPWRSGGPRQMERWFSGNLVHWGDDPDRSRYSYDFPDQLGFFDADGAVGLVGCRVAGYRSNFGGTNAAQGRVQAQLAVLGAGTLSWRHVNAVRTYIPELGDWMGLTSLKKRATRDNDGNLRQFDLTLESMPDIALARRLNVRAVPTWRVQPDRFGPHQVHDESYIQTSAVHARTWQEHFDVHQSVRELLDIAAWEAFGYNQITACRFDDPSRLMNGDYLGEQWCDVRTYAVRSERKASTLPNYLFRFADIGSKGYRRWLVLRKKFERGLSPILGLLNLDKSYLQNLVMQTSLGLEAIGYQLARESGKSSKQATDMRFKERMELIKAELPVPTIQNDWPDRSAATYNGVKHANRPLPDVVAMRAAADENILALRVWVAARIGVPKSTLEATVPVDRIRQSLNHLGLKAEPAS